MSRWPTACRARPASPTFSLTVASPTRCPRCDCWEVFLASVRALRSSRAAWKRSLATSTACRHRSRRTSGPVSISRAGAGGWRPAIEARSIPRSSSGRVRRMWSMAAWSGEASTMSPWSRWWPGTLIRSSPSIQRWRTTFDRTRPGRKSRRCVAAVSFSAQGFHMAGSTHRRPSIDWWACNTWHGYSIPAGFPTISGMSPAAWRPGARQAVRRYHGASLVRS
jgi:hypothetical protein